MPNRWYRSFFDSGSRFNRISLKDWSFLQDIKATIFNVRPNCSNNFREYASDELLPMICISDAPIAVSPRSEIIAPFFVIINGKQSLFGKETAIKLKVLQLGLGVYKIVNVSLFSKWNGLPVKLSIDPNIVPIPIEFKNKVMTKLDEAPARDIIEPVLGHSSWISPMVIVFKENGDHRICIDMRLANKAISRENYPLPVFETFITRR